MTDVQAPPGDAVLDSTRRRTEAAQLKHNLVHGSRYEQQKAKAMLQSDSEEDDKQQTDNNNNGNKLSNATDEPAVDAPSDSNNNNDNNNDNNDNDNNDDNNSVASASLSSSSSSLDFSQQQPPQSQPQLTEQPTNTDNGKLASASFIDNKSPRQSSEDWLAQYRQKKSEWLSKYTENNQPTSRNNQQQFPEVDVSVAAKYNAMVAQRNHFFEAQKLAEQWREIDNQMKQIGGKELTQIIDFYLNLTNSNSNSGGPVFVLCGLAREAVVRILEIVRAPSLHSPQSSHGKQSPQPSLLQSNAVTMINEIVSSGGIRVLCNASRGSDSVIGSEAVRVLAAIAEFQEFHHELIKHGAVKTLCYFAALRISVDSFSSSSSSSSLQRNSIAPSKLLNVCRECGCAVKLLAQDGKCQVKVAEEYTLEKLVLVAHCQDAIRRIHASDTLSALLSNRYQVLKVLQSGKLGVLIGLCHSSYNALSLMATDALVPLLQAGLLTTHLTKSRHDIDLLVSVAGHRRPAMQEAVLKTLSVLTASVPLASRLANSEHGLFRTLLACVFDNRGTTQAKHNALIVLENLCATEFGAVRVVCKGYLHVIGQLVVHPSHAVRIAAVRVFGALCKFELLHEALVIDTLATVISSVPEPVTDAAPAFNAAVAKSVLTLAAFSATHASIESDNAVQILVAFAAVKHPDYSPPAIKALQTIAQNPNMHKVLNDNQALETCVNVYLKPLQSKKSQTSEPNVPQRKPSQFVTTISNDPNGQSGSWHQEPILVGTTDVGPSLTGLLDLLDPSKQTRTNLLKDEGGLLKIFGL